MSLTPNMKIVIVAPNWLGDAVMSLPLVGTLARVPGVRVSVLAPQYTARVYSGVDGVDELTVFRRASRLAAVTRCTRLLRQLRADAAVILPPSFSSAVAPFAAGVGVRAGFRTDGRRGLLNRPVAVVPRQEEHLSKNYLRLGDAALAGLGIELPENGSASPALRVFTEDAEDAERLLRESGLSGNRFVVVVPGAAFGPAKAWPRECFRGLVKRISSSVPVVLAGGAGDVELCRWIGDGLHRVYDLSGMTPLGTFFGVMKAARMVVANDSGSPHAAAALERPVVALFGSTSPDWTAPVGERVEVVQHPVHCNPCFSRTCPTQLECFNSIEVADVAARVVRAL